MKEKLIQEISTAMAEVLSFEQVAHLNSVLLQVVSQYTITEDGETLHENAVSNDRLLDIFLSAKQVEAAPLRLSNTMALPFGSCSKRCLKR